MKKRMLKKRIKKLEYVLNELYSAGGDLDLTEEWLDQIFSVLTGTILPHKSMLHFEKRKS